MIKKYKHWVDQNRYPGPLEYELGSTQVYLHRDDLRCDNDASKIQQFEFEPWYSTNEATAPNLANELKVFIRTNARESISEKALNFNTCAN